MTTSIAIYRWAICVIGIAVAAGVGGCGAAGNYALGAAGGTALLAQSPSNEIQQVYYLGVFDPQDQVPSTMYRVTVHGQASALSLMKFGSGWVKASLIDSLNTSVKFADGTTRPTIDAGGEETTAVKTGRRMYLYGPEGFREAPRDQRLVIVMGANPEGFFNALDGSLGDIARAQVEAVDNATAQVVNQELLRLQGDQNRLKDLKASVAADVAAEGK